LEQATFYFSAPKEMGLILLCTIKGNDISIGDKSGILSLEVL